MGDHSRQFEKIVLARLKGLARRLRGYVLLDGLAVLAVSVLLASGFQLLVDWSLRLRADMRAALLAVLVTVIGVVIWRRVITPLRRRYGVYEAACLIEQRHPELQSLLVSALQFFTARRGGLALEAANAACGVSEASNSPRLIGAVIEETARRTADLPVNALLNHRRAARSGGAGLAVVLVFLAAWLMAPQIVGLWFKRNILLADVSWPQRTHLSVKSAGSNITAARGDDLEIRGEAHGEVPRQVEIIFDIPGRKTGRETMIAVGAREFRYTFPHVEQDFTFALRGGDDRTAAYQVRLVDRPRVEHSVMRVSPPKYTGIQPNDSPANQRAVETLPGSEVEIRIETNKPVAKAILRAGDAVVGSASPSESSTDAAALAWHVRFRPEQTQSFHFDLADAAGLEDKRPVRFSVRMIKDEPPRARLKLTGVGDMITPEAVLPVELEFSDAYGLATADFVYQFSSRAAPIAGTEHDLTGPVNAPLPDFAPGTTVFSTRLEWPVSTAQAVPGDRLTVFAQASDRDDVSGPNVGQAAGVTMRVVTRDDLLAELARREQELRQAFERLVEAQDQLRGQLLSLLGRMGDAAIMKEFDRAMAGHERRQRQIAAQVNVIRQQFEQVLAEMRVNQMDTSVVQERLGQGVIQPLGRLARRDMITAADGLRRLAGEPLPELASTVDPLQAEIVHKMRQILNQMIKWEGFQETVTMLRDILRLQGELNAETEEAIKRQAEEIFGK